ncbi:MAG: Lrp/AsnC family transcriptional regulator [Desulfovibrio sp.]|uniref:Lrp/AsnC family transcriptional regulator n=1 Tax=Desulfovibrio sp. 7SRBS1 TaxID=3378064 RepID=UPI003B3C985E
MDDKPYSLDALDIRIIKELQENGRESFTNIAKRLGVSDGTVRYRTERMMRSGYLQVTASVDPLYHEDTLTALVGLSLDHPANRQLMERIAEIPGVQSVINVTGRYDLVVEVYTTSRKALRRFLVDELSEIGGVTSTESFVVMEAVGKRVILKEDIPVH